MIVFMIREVHPLAELLMDGKLNGEYEVLVGGTGGISDWFQTALYTEVIIATI